MPCAIVRDVPGTALQLPAFAGSVTGLKRSDWWCAVAYVKYERASSAAAAMEALHEAILEDGRTKLKVLLAEAPHATCALPAPPALTRSAWHTS